MNANSYQFGRWQITCAAADGARITQLRYGRLSLLTAAPDPFQAPRQDFGRYERRPVFGYDDCFPSIDSCRYPTGAQAAIPDHGELCWLPWRVEPMLDGLRCDVRSQLLPVRFCRTMTVTDSSLAWSFEVSNEGDSPLPFLHVMHALMPLTDIVGIELPGFHQVVDELHGVARVSMNPRQLSNSLLECPSGIARMLLLHDIDRGELRLRFRTGERLHIRFSSNMFPTLGIWWDHGGYPDEAGLQRFECAFEPMAGRFSSLAKSYDQGSVQTAYPGEPIRWTIHWDVVANIT